MNVEERTKFKSSSCYTSKEKRYIKENKLIQNQSLEE